MSSTSCTKCEQHVHDIHGRTDSLHASHDRVHPLYSEDTTVTVTVKVKVTAKLNFGRPQNDLLTVLEVL